MTTLSVFTQDQVLSDSNTIHSGDTIVLTGIEPGTLVPGASENAPESPKGPGGPLVLSTVPAGAGPRAEITLQTLDLAELDFAQGDTIFLIGHARGGFKGVQRAGDFEVNPEGVRILAPGDMPMPHIPRAGDVHDILPDGSDEGYQTS